VLRTKSLHEGFLLYCMVRIKR